MYHLQYLCSFLPPNIWKCIFSELTPPSNGSSFCTLCIFESPAEEHTKQNPPIRSMLAHYFALNHPEQPVKDGLCAKNEIIVDSAAPTHLSGVPRTVELRLKQPTADSRGGGLRCVCVHVCHTGAQQNRQPSSSNTGHPVLGDWEAS